MHYSCTHVTTVGIKGLREESGYRAVDNRAALSVRTTSGRVAVRATAVLRQSTFDAFRDWVTWHTPVIVGSWRSG